ncbi:piriformospora indica-insensitive protein 2-like [Nicotiana tomentosiformis]|uniref:piriformospora indica-insensitive protein 2-like n=1 Tax=Nicotiana tomentosiformis TaxID=4098 RepID=UPI00051C560F|nr:piriformospora indica-insensitive protein 2-like [Nicotiana tomentosiformis]
MNNFIIKIQIMFLQFVLVGVYIMYKGAADASGAPMEKYEKDALYSAIQGFVGNEWNGSYLYPDPCGWTTIEGVSCDFSNGFWHITDLSIGQVYDNSLSCSPAAEFREDLFKLKHLKRLSFSNCFLSSHHKPITIPTSNWNSLANSLESLEFRSNPSLTGTIPTSFGNLKNLQSLVLVENRLKGEIPEALGGLIKLVRLVLSGNSFEGPIPASLGKLTNLLIFDTNRNFLSGSLPVTFGNLTSLIKLDLSNNLFDGKLPREIGGLKSVTLLDLSHNKFSGGLPKIIQEMISLKELVLSNNPIGDYVTTIQWQKLKNLEILDLSNMGLKGNIPNSMTEMKKLRFLSLSNNSLSGNILSKFDRMPTIYALYLDGNDFTGKLEFSTRFYDKLRSRFRASGNMNLCSSLELMSTRHVPEGVKQCEQDSIIHSEDSDSSLKNEFLNQNLHFIASLGHSGHVVSGFTFCYVVRIILMALLWII